MFDMNRIQIMGNLGKAPEIRTTTNGKDVMSFSVATRESWKDKQTNEWQERTEWHRIVIFNEHLIQRAGNYLTKGSRVYVEGKLKVREWEDKEGNKRITPEIVLSGFEGTVIPLAKADKLGESQADPYPPKEEPAGKPGGQDLEDDDLPF